MLWPFLAAVAIGTAFVRLGFLTAMFSVASVLLRIAVAMLVVFAVVFVLGRITKTS